MALRIHKATLATNASKLGALQRFYLDELGLNGGRDERELRVSVGADELTFAAAAGDPFYHFALLVPGNRFEAARDWLAPHSPILPDSESGELVFDFDNWQALACYAHDPAGNIVELIAHRGVDESGETGAFGAAELRGVSELGIVTTDLVAALDRLRASGLELWSGNVTGPREGFGFIGRKAHTLILCPAGRPWLPTGRPAEQHPVEVVVGDHDRAVSLAF